MSGIFGGIANGFNNAQTANNNYEVLQLKKEGAAISNAAAMEELQRIKNLRAQEAQAAKLNQTVLDGATVSEMVPEEYRDPLVKRFKQMGYMSQDGTTTVGQLKQFQQYMSNSPFIQGELSTSAISFSRQKIYEINQALTQEQNPKKREELIGQKQAWTQKLNQNLNSLNEYNQQFNSLLTKYTPESVQAFEQTVQAGQPNRNVLKESPGEQKDNRTTNQKEYATYVAQQEKAGKQPMGFEEWMGKGGEKPQMKLKDLTTRIDKLQKELHRVESGETDALTAALMSQAGVGAGEVQGDPEAKKFYTDFLKRTIKSTDAQIQKLRGASKKYDSPEAVQTAYQNGEISEKDAAAILKKNWPDKF